MRGCWISTSSTRTDSCYNPATGTYDKVRLRSYNGTDVDPDTPYVSPTIEAVPGDTVYVNLHNQLPADPSCAAHDPAPGEPYVNDPHCFNGTNLHTHGLWVNPAGNGDNVLLSINPGVKFQYEYKIPGGHPAGTFWYHTHRHGSTALQVSSGMAGALIIRGDRLPTATTHGRSRHAAGRPAGAGDGVPADPVCLPRRTHAGEPTRADQEG